MANDLVLAKLRFDTAALDGQLKAVTDKLNKVKELAAQAQKVAASMQRGSTGKADSFNTSMMREVTSMYSR